jgi:Putative Actinobacterial Holin-X, holin superfamily III
LSDRPTADDLYRGGQGDSEAGRTTVETGRTDRPLGGASTTARGTSLPGGPPRPTEPPPAPTLGPARPTVEADVGARARSPGQLVKEISEDFSTLIRKEIELAKQEIGSSVATKAKGAAIVAVGAVFGLFALVFLLLALRDGLDEFLWTWLADIVTALVLLAIGGIAVLIARKKLSAPIETELTKQTVKEDIEWAKTLGKR